MERRKERRTKRRITCDILVGGERHSGILLDASPGGLFVQTSAKFSPDTEVGVHLRASYLPDGLVVCAAVVRQKKAPARLSSVVKSGMALRILAAPNAYYQLLGAGRVTTEGGPNRRAEETPETDEGAKRFRVRLKQQQGSRSRTLLVSSDTAAGARRRGLAEVGEDWEVLAVEPA